MPAINGQAVIFDFAGLVAGTKVGTVYDIDLAPDPTTGDHTQQVWAMISWSGLSAGDLQVNVYNLPADESPAVKSQSPLVVGQLVDSTNTPAAQTTAAGCQQVFVEVAGPRMRVDAVVTGAGTPDVTVTLLSTGLITVTP